jgi:hypothetical protein
MKNLTIVRALLPLLLTAPLAAGQTAAPTDNLRAVDRVITARSQYTLDDGSRAGNDAMLAQIPGRAPGPVFPRRPGYPPPGYPGMWAPGGAGHPVAGALIGFCSERLPLAPPIQTREGASWRRSGEQPSEPCSALRLATQPRFSTGGSIAAVRGQTPTKPHRRRLIAGVLPYGQLP